MHKTITIIGSSNIDMIMKMERLPRLGETITDAEYMQTYGGKGANQAVGAARAGGNVCFVNCVGDDIFAIPMVENFKYDKIDTSYIFQEKGISSGTALVMIGGEGNNYLSVAPGANYRLTPGYIETAMQSIREADIIIIQNEIPADTNSYVINKACELGKKIMYNFAPAKNIDLRILKYVWMLVVNETEAEFLTGIAVNEDNVHSASEKLSTLGPEIVIITLGAKGSYIYSREVKIHLPANKVEAIDTTAAGDVYCGSLAVALVEGKSLVDSVKFAGAASAIAVTRLGAQPSAPYRDEIDGFLFPQQT